MANKPLPLINNPVLTSIFMERFRTPNPAKFQVGDQITFRKLDGSQQIILILGIDGDRVGAIFYTGMPHLIHLTLADLDALRIERIDKFGVEDVNMYRRNVGLDQEVPA
ncbi:MAG TPA: hypothetical protein VGC14_26695 [Rhizobium sp.]